MRFKLHALGSGLAALLLASLPPQAQAQAQAQAPAPGWPDKPIRLVVTTPAGGPVDVLARVLGEAVSLSLQQPVIVENRPGASGGTGSAHLKQQAADGYTLMLTANAAFYLMPVIRKMPYRPFDDFSFIGQMAYTPNVLVVPAASPARTVADFVALAKAQPGVLNYGTMLGIPQHLDFERFKRAAALDIALVPYTGGAPIVTALLSNQIQVTLMNVPLVAEWVKTGKLRALATPAAQRAAALPDVPTMAEAGFGHLALDAGQAFSLVGPAGLPKALADKIYQAFAAAATDPERRKKLEAAGFEIALRDAASLKADLLREGARTEALVKALDFKLAE